MGAHFFRKKKFYKRKKSYIHKRYKKAYPQQQTSRFKVKMNSLDPETFGISNIEVNITDIKKQWPALVNTYQLIRLRGVKVEYYCPVDIATENGYRAVVKMATNADSTNAHFMDATNEAISMPNNFHRYMLIRNLNHEDVKATSAWALERYANTRKIPFKYGKVKDYRKWPSTYLTGSNDEPRVWISGKKWLSTDKSAEWGIHQAALWPDAAHADSKLRLIYKLECYVECKGFKAQPLPKPSDVFKIQCNYDAAAAEA